MTQREKPIEIINPPNMLKVKVGGKLPAADQAMIQRAENALNNLKTEFGDWLGEEVTKLEEYLKAAKTQGMTSDMGEMLFTCAHDLRGLGSTYEFPIITRIAASLSKLIETPEQRGEVPLTLVEAHVGAIRAAVNQNIRDESDPIGAQLAEELESRVVALVGERK
ncbi:MAG: Hpt domain-containing protein [Oceanicaulis sp.]